MPFFINFFNTFVLHFIITLRVLVKHWIWIVGTEDYGIQSLKCSRFYSQYVKQPALDPSNKMLILEGHCFPKKNIKGWLERHLKYVNTVLRKFFPLFSNANITMICNLFKYTPEVV